MDVDLNMLAARAWRAIDMRRHNGANVATDAVGTLKHAAGEVVEAVQAYGTVAKDEILYCDADLTNYNKSLFAKEVADVVVCCLVAINAEFGKDEGFDFGKVLTDVVSLQEDRAAKKGDKL